MYLYRRLYTPIQNEQSVSTASSTPSVVPIEITGEAVISDIVPVEIISEAVVSDQVSMRRDNALKRAADQAAEKGTGATTGIYMNMFLSVCVYSYMYRYLYNKYIHYAEEDLEIDLDALCK